MIGRLVSYQQTFPSLGVVIALTCLICGICSSKLQQKMPWAKLVQDAKQEIHETLLWEKSDFNMIIG
jgi:L-lactate utilization protein LutB